MRRRPAAEGFDQAGNGEFRGFDGGFDAMLAKGLAGDGADGGRSHAGWPCGDICFVHQTKEIRYGGRTGERDRVRKPAGRCKRQP